MGISTRVHRDALRLFLLKGRAVRGFLFFFSVCFRTTRKSHGVSNELLMKGRGRIRELKLPVAVQT